MGSMSHMKLSVMIVLLGALVLGAPREAAADDFYKGKTISVVVGATPGGAFDIVSRVLVRYLGKYIPGSPNVIIQNMPGAGSMTAIRYIVSTAPKDGTVIGTFLPGIITQSLVTPEKVTVDFRDVAWIGVTSGDLSRLCYGYGPNGISTFADLMQLSQSRPFIMGTTGTGASNYINGMALKDVLGANIKIILGFPGSSEMRLAIERGELDGDCGGVSSLPPDWLKNGRIHAFVRFAEQLGPGVPSEAVYIKTLTKSDEQARFLDFLFGADKLGRPFITSKDVPTDRLAILRIAFDAAMKDPGLIGDLEKLSEAVQPLTGDAAEQIYKQMSSAPQSLVVKARKYYE